MEYSSKGTIHSSNLHDIPRYFLHFPFYQISSCPNDRNINILGFKHIKLGVLIEYNCITSKEDRLILAFSKSADH